MTMKAKPSYEELERRVQELEKIESKYNSSREALRKSETLFRLLYEKAPLGYQSLDENGHFIVVNQTWLDTLGYAKEEVIGKTFADFLHPDWRNHFKENFPRFKSIGEVLGVEFEMVKKNGDLILVSFTGKISRDEKGNFQQTHCIFNDITERKKHEELLERYKNIVSSTTDAIAYLDENYRYIIVNNAYENFSGANRDDFVGMTVAEYIGKDIFEEKIKSNLDRCLNGEIVNYQEWFEYPAKENRFFDVTYFPYRDGENHISGVIANTRDITERKQTENDLERVHYSIENMTESVFWVGKDGSFIDFNNTSCERLGYSREELIKMNVSDIDPHYPQERWQTHWEEVKSHGIMFETVHRAKNGQLIPMELVIHNQQYGDSRYSCVLGRDITERKQAETKQKEDEKLLNSTLEAVDSLLMVIDKEHRILLCNWKDHEWVPAEDRKKRPYCYKIMKNFDSPCEGCPPTKTFRDGQPRWYEDRNPIDGSYKEISVIPIFNDNGEVEYVLENVRDVTERKQAETYREMGREILQILNEPGDLHESIQRVLATLKTRAGVDAVGLRLQEGEDFPYFAQDGFSRDFLLTENTLLERGNDGGVCRDKDGNVRLECTCGLVISGKTDPSNPLFTQGGSSWNNDSFPFLDLPPDQDPRLHPRNNCIHQGYASVALIPVRTSDRIVGLIQLNDKRKGRFTLETIEMLEGIAAHVGSALMRKRAEDEQEKLQTRLHQAQKMESVGRLAGGVAHDFNNMLGVILGYTELALLKTDEDNDNDLLSDLKEIQTAAKRSANITKQLLAFARKEIISPRQLELNDTVESMLNMLRRLIGEDIDLVWQPAARLWPVKMDPSQIDQILANLCVNARDAISGVGKLTIETGKQTFDEKYCSDHPGFTPGDFVLLAVSDNGCGMDKETQDNLFEPFFTTKEVGKGTGLGLATIYGIVKQNNGFINVYSEPDQGSTFKIYLPRMVADEDADKVVSEKKTAAGGTETILLVEDEPSILRMIQMMLKRKGYTVLSAATPTEAFEKAKDHSGSIDLLMTDVIMPEMHGRSLAEKITDIYPDIRLLFMSGYTADVIAHHGILDEGVAFIQKPFSMADLTEKLREVLETASDKT